jgi:tetratricopeptide (TPR) repeat protein
MSDSIPSGGRIAEENELLAQLGLPPSATPEDVDQLHLAVSQFLAAAPTGIKGWARAQAAVLDEAYLQLTDPVGLEGSALRSPTRPPTVAPGGPATPPARRDSVPAAAADEADEDAVEEPEETAAEPVADAPDEAETAAAVDDTDTDDMDALYASVTPGAHRDMVSGGKAATPARLAPAATAVAAGQVSGRGQRHAKGRAATPAAPVVAPAGSGPWKLVAIATSVLLALVLLFGFAVPFVFNLGAGATAADASVAPSASGPTVDMAQITSLMTQLQSNPNDTDLMMQIGNVYFQGADYADAATFYDKVLAINPNDPKALLAAGAAAYNLQDTATAEKDWKQVVALKPTDTSLAQEVHYDLGILYMHAANPDWASVLSEWQQVITIDPTSSYAQSVQQYAAAIAGASMVPASLVPELNGLASPLPSTAPSAAPTGSATPSGAAAAPSGSVAPAGSAAASASTLVNEGAKGQAFTSGTLKAPANTPFTIHFDNQDAGLPHDMLIKDSAGNTVFKGDMVTGPGTVDYQVPALSAGTYTFTDTVYPTTMNGTLVVGG